MVDSKGRAMSSGDQKAPRGTQLRLWRTGPGQNLEDLDLFEGVVPGTTVGVFGVGLKTGGKSELASVSS